MSTLNFKLVEKGKGKGKGKVRKDNGSHLETILS
jgi:hypothetical protein